MGGGGGGAGLIGDNLNIVYLWGFEKKSFVAGISDMVLSILFTHINLYVKKYI